MSRLAWGSPWRSWKKELWRGKSGLPCLFCCPATPPQVSSRGWMDGWMYVSWMFYGLFFFVYFSGISCFQSVALLCLLHLPNEPFCLSPVLQWLRPLTHLYRSCPLLPLWFPFPSSILDPPPAACGFGVFLDTYWVLGPVPVSSLHQLKL